MGRACDFDLLKSCVWLFIWERERANWRENCFTFLWNWIKKWPNNIFLKNISAKSQLAYFEEPVNELVDFLFPSFKHFPKKSSSKKRLDSCIMEIKVFCFKKFIFLLNIDAQNFVLRPYARRIWRVWLKVRKKWEFGRGVLEMDFIDKEEARSGVWPSAAQKLLPQQNIFRNEVVECRV